MSRIIRRTLASITQGTPGPSTLPYPSAASASSTLPLAVRRRRALNPSQTPQTPLSDPSAFLGKTPKVLPGKLEDEFQRLRSLNQFKGDELSARRAFLKTQIAWRSRVRGVDEVKTEFITRYNRELEGEPISIENEENEGMESTSDSSKTKIGLNIVAQKIYLPNIQIRLVRNHVPPGEAYDPMIATFRIPQSMTKTDLRSYLMAAYNLPVTFIRTANYIASLARSRGGQIRRKQGKSYKKAVVGLNEPFHYPDDVEELRAMEDGERLAKSREDWLDENYRLDDAKTYRKRMLMKYYKGYRWRAKEHDNGGNTVRAIMKKRNAKEEKVALEVARMRANGVSQA